MPGRSSAACPPPPFHSALGEPRRQVRNFLGELEDLWDGLKVCYSTSEGTVTEVQISPPSQALLDGNDLLGSNDPISLLMRYDSDPLQSAGIVVFLSLGIAVTGFEDRTDILDRAVTVFAAGSDSVRTESLALPSHLGSYAA